MDNYQKFFKQGWLCLALIAIGLTWSVGVQATTLCLAPIPANALVDPFTGNLDLRWVGGSKAKTYTLKILTLGKACSEPATSPGESEITTIPGTANSYTIPDANLDCGKWQYCLQAECCDDSCETCGALGKIPVGADYCTAMSGLMGDPGRCACPTNEHPTYNQNSFYFKCSNGQKYHTLAGCLAPEKIVGCSWECAKIGTMLDYTTCGKDYDIKCGLVNKLLIHQVPTFNLCSVDGKTKDDYLIPPVVPKPIPAFSYNWTCLGQKPAEQCVACRQAVCNTDYLNKAVYDLPNSGDLCKENDGTINGTITGVPTTPVDDTATKQWTWDCVGSTDCDVYDKQGHLISTPNITSCIAKEAGCGEANNKFYTLYNFRKLSGSNQNFVCLNGGIPQPVGFSSPGGGWDVNDPYHYRQEYQKEPTADALYWVCTYPNLGEVKCQSNIIDCNSSAQDKKLTVKNWTDNYNTADAANKLCQNGLDDKFDSSQGALGPVSDFNWSCQDNFGGLVSCSAKEVNCKTPPHNSYVADVTKVQGWDSSLLCINGDVVQTPQIIDSTYPTDPKNIKKVTWNCSDSDSWKAPELPLTCFATQLSCAKPPSGESFANFDELTKNPSITCVPGGTNTYICSGVCNDPNYNPQNKGGVEVTLVDNKWTWTCGVASCEAKMTDCAKPPANDYSNQDNFIYNYFSDLPGFRDWVTSSHVGTCTFVDNKLSCTGVCTDKNFSAEITLKDGKFTWPCGGKICEASQAGCGEYGTDEEYQINAETRDTNGKSTANGFSDWQIANDNGKFCLNKGTPVWFNDKDYFGITNYGKPEPGFTPYGNGGFKSREQGKWLWQCSYPKDATLHGNSKYYLGDGSQRQFFCAATEKPECNSLDSDIYTIDELITASNIDNQLGNAYTSAGNLKSGAYLCKRGVMSYAQSTKSISPDGVRYITYVGSGGSNESEGLHITSPATAQFNSNFAKVLASTLYYKGSPLYSGNNNNFYLYQCTSPVGSAEGPMCAVNVKGCATPPDGGSYTSDTNFKNVYAGGCEGGLTANDKNFDETDYSITDGSCNWNWKCAGDQCSAAKNGDLTAEITGSASVCAKNENIYSVTNIKGCAPADVAVAWTVTPTDPSITGSGTSLTIPADTLVDGIYEVTATVTCLKPVCTNKTSVEVKKQIIVSKQKQTPTLGLNATSPICKGESITYTVTPDSKCEGASYDWTEPGCASTSATCPKTYDQAGTYPKGDVKVTVNCTNCYASEPLESPEIKVNWYEDPTGVSVTPELTDLKLCEGDTSDHIFEAKALFSDDTLEDCSDVGYVWSYGKTKATEAEFSQNAKVNLKTLSLNAGDYSITVTAKCKSCSKKTSVPSSYTIHVYKGPYAGSIEAAETICSDKSPAKLQSKMISGLPDDAKDYKTNGLEWQNALAIAGVCPDEKSSAWGSTNIYTQNYIPLPTLTETTCYRRVARANEPCVDKYSNNIIITVETILPQSASITVDKTPICAKNKETAIFRAHADDKCENPKYTWTGCTQDATDKAKCTKTYLNRGAYTGEVRVTITCDNCYEDWSDVSPLVTADWFNEPIGVTLTPSPLNVCENDATQDQAFLAEATYADNSNNCTKVKYVWKIAGQTLGGSNETFDLKTLDPKLSVGKHAISVTAQCEDNCSVKTPTSPTTAEITVNPAPTLSNITPTTESCSANPSAYGVTVNHCTAGTVNWTLTNKETGVAEPAEPGDDGAITNTSYTPPKDLIGGVYALKVDMTCTNPCSGGDSKTIDITIRKPSIHTLNGPGTICAEAPGDYNAFTKDCDNGVINWTITDKSTGKKIDSVSETDFKVISFDYLSKYKPGPTKHPRLNPGEYTVTSTLSCSSPCAGDDVKFFDFTVKPQPVLNETGGNKFDFCSDVPESYTSGSKDCEAGDITWTLKDKDGKTVDGKENDSYNNANYTPKTGLPAGTYTLETVLNCTDPCSGTGKKWKTITVNPAPEPGIIAANQNICSEIEDPAIFTSVNDGNCGSYQWEKSTVTDTATGPVCDNNNWKQISNALAKTYDEGPLTKSTCYHRLCINACDSLGKPTDSLIITVKPQPSFDSLEGDKDKEKEFCLANPMEYTASTSNCDKGTVAFVVIDEGTGKLVPNSEKSVPISNNSAKYTPQPKPLTNGSGTYSVQATMHCTDPCKVDDDEPKTLSGIKVYDCICGSANGKNFVGASDNTLTEATDTGDKIFCKGDCKAVPNFDPNSHLNLNGDGWDWHCKCGGLDPIEPGCSAKQTKCGTASTEGFGSDRIYTKDSWTSVATSTTAKCINALTVVGFSEKNNQAEPNENNPCTKTINDTREWNCQDSVGHTLALACSNKILDCGIADANRILNCSNTGYNKLQPYDRTLDLWSGSYTAQSDLTDTYKDHLCNYSDKVKVNAFNTNRGKWSWECGDDSAGKSLTCEARNDCDWATRTDSKGTQQFTTVDYGAAGCWTAEDVGKYNDNSTTDLTWGRAMRIKMSASDLECNKDPQWLGPIPACKNSHCPPHLLLTATCTIKGVCPDGYNLPQDTDWHNLEKSLSNNGSCDANRLNPVGGSGVDSGKFDCAPAGNGNVKGYENDGLRDEVTFAGVSGAGYWTRSTEIRLGIPKLYPKRTLFYYKLDGSSGVGRAADYNNNTPFPDTSEGDYQTHEVRCYAKPGAQGLIGGSGSGKQQCYGWVCNP